MRTDRPRPETVANGPPPVTAQSKSGQSKSGQSKSGQSKSGQSRSGLCRNRRVEGRDIFPEMRGLSRSSQNDAIADMTFQEREGGFPRVLAFVRLDKRAHGKEAVDDGTDV